MDVAMAAAMNMTMRIGTMTVTLVLMLDRNQIEFAMTHSGF